MLDTLWLLPGLLLATALLVPPTTTGDALGVRRFRTNEVSTDYRVAQRFRMNGPDLSAVEIRAIEVGQVSGSFRLVLRDLDARSVERTAEVTASDLVRDPRYVFRFAPIARSADHQFELEITPSADTPGHGVALWATKGERAEENALRINDVPRWGSLAFQTHTPSVSLGRVLMNRRDSGDPRRWLVLVGWVGAWLALRFVLHAIPASRSPSPLESANPPV